MERRESGDKLIGRDYFIEILGEGSQDFVELEKLVEDSDGKISWEHLQQFTRIESGMVEGIYRESGLDLRLTRVKSLGKFKTVRGNLNCEGLENLEDLGILEEVGWNLDLRGTRVRSLGNLKRIRRQINCFGLKTLENLGKLEEVGGYLYLGGTSVKSLGKLNVVKLGLDCYGLTCLEDLGDLEEVGGYLDLRGIKIELQLEVMKRISEGKLKVGKNIIYGGNIEGIEKILELDTICGDLNLICTRTKLQLEVMKRVSEGKLKVGGDIYYDEIIKLLKIEEILKGEINLYGDVKEIEWIRLFREKLGDYAENDDEELKKIRIETGKILMGKYIESIKEYLERNKDKLNQEMADSIEKDLNEKLGLFKSLFGEEIFSNKLQ